MSSTMMLSGDLFNSLRPPGAARYWDTMEWSKDGESEHWASWSVWAMLVQERKSQQTQIQVWSYNRCSSPRSIHLHGVVLTESFLPYVRQSVLSAILLGHGRLPCCSYCPNRNGARRHWRSNGEDEELSEREDPIPKRVQISAAWNHQLVTTGSGTPVVPVVMDDLEGTARSINVHPQEKICLIQPFTRCFRSLREKNRSLDPATYYVNEFCVRDPIVFPSHTLWGSVWCEKDLWRFESVLFALQAHSSKPVWYGRMAFGRGLPDLTHDIFQNGWRLSKTHQTNSNWIQFIKISLGGHISWGDWAP